MNIQDVFNLPLRTKSIGPEIEEIWDAEGSYVASCYYAEDADAIIFACNNFPALSEQNARLITSLTKAVNGLVALAKMSTEMPVQIKALEILNDLGISDKPA